MGIYACRKESAAPDIPAEGTRMQLSLDSLFLYARETYLWHHSLPGYQQFNPRQYDQTNNGFNDMQMALKGIAAYSYDRPGGIVREFRNGNAHPLYSYITKKSAVNNQETATGLQQISYGLGLGWMMVNEENVYVSYVEKNSPAYTAGVRKGMQLTSINGQPVKHISDLNHYINMTSINGDFKKEDGSLRSINIIAQTYSSDPVLQYETWRIKNKSIGYLAFSAFNKLDGSKIRIDEVFNHFSTKEIEALIIDLRYNTGGYVKTVAYIANQIAPASLTGKVMYSEHFNELLQNRNAPILKSIPYLDESGQQVYLNGRAATFADIDFSINGNTSKFNSASKLNRLSTIIFIVNATTASASELLINSFKPYLNVKLVGEKTYGKPVGFFGINIDQFTVYLAQFNIKNALGQGDYFDGIPVDIPAQEEPGKELGDTTENNLAKAIEYITTGNVSSSVSQRRVLKLEPVLINKFVGMIKEL